MRSMLREIRACVRISPGSLRRWFQDDYFDLFVWLTPARCGERLSARLRAHAPMSAYWPGPATDGFVP